MTASLSHRIMLRGMFFATAWCLFGASVVCAGRSDQTPRDDPQPEQKVAPAERRVSFDFPGGSLRDYVLRVTELSDGFNVVVDPVIADARVAAVQAKQMPAADAVAILEQLVEVNIEPVGKEGTLIVTAREVDQSSQRVTDVFSVRDLLTHYQGNKDDSMYSLDDILSAIEAALNMTATPGGNQSHHIKLHRETGLLLIEGSLADVHIIIKVIEQLRQGQNTSAENKRRELPLQLFEKEQEIAELRSVIRERELQVQQMEVQLRLLEVQLQKARQRD